jgi:uncharacterized protein YecE (DUF72 family)
MARIRIGTSSWSQHTDFYPAGLPSSEQISYYAKFFPVVEVNSTFYVLVSTRNFELWAERTPPDFIFDVKPYRQLTWHDRKNPPDDDVMRVFCETLQPLRDAKKLGAVHFQFPPWFQYDAKNIDYIKHVREFFEGDELGVEFRHRSWMTEDHLPEVLEIFRSNHIGLTVVDEPQLGSGSVPTILEVTDPDLVIVRFHGRNYKKWYAKVKETGERFDYLYSEDELREWVPKVSELAGRAKEVHLLFNNNAQNYAVQNGQQLRMLLEEEHPKDVEVVPPPGS